jgi:hypothetical protein
LPRDHARVRLDIWTDDDFTDLTSPAQWLYIRLWSAAGLNYAGVTDWRPGRIAASCAELTATDVEMIAKELETGEYVVIDRRSEECLIRSFVKHDGFMDKWNMAAAYCSAWASVSSKALRGVAVHELKKLHRDNPDWKTWDRDDVKQVLGKRAITPSLAREMTEPNPIQSPSESPLERGAE